MFISLRKLFRIFAGVWIPHTPVFLLYAPMNDILKNKISMLPDKPGCYLYYDKVGTVIYVGKAKRLKRRVSSYFNRVHDSVKTNVLVSNIADMRYIVVGSEDDALHLENSLIKEYKPRYNILLKDDKSYPWICVTNELYPRVFLTRNVMPKGGRGGAHAARASEGALSAAVVPLADYG